MRKFIIALALLLTACSEQKPIISGPAETVTITNFETVPVTNTVTNTVTVTEPDTDLCDIWFRAYGPNDAWIDVTVGAMPIINMTTVQTLYVVDGIAPLISFDVRSHSWCGDVDINGIKITIERMGDPSFPYERYSGPTNFVTTANNVWEAPVGWSGDTQDTSTADSLWIAWIDGSADIETGEFGTERLMASDIFSYELDLPVMATLPSGDYVVTTYLLWTDVETGTYVGPTTVEPNSASSDEYSVQTYVTVP